MPTYYWKIQALLNTGIHAELFITINTNTPERAKKILITHIIKMTRFGIPRLFITPKAKIVISHSNDVRISNLPFINIDYLLLQKILSFAPSLSFELNHNAIPFIPNFDY